jgi:hypothetical protein
MQTVNQYMVGDLLNPLGGSADIDEKIYQYQNVDSNDEEQIKKIILENIKPHFENQSELYKSSAKRSLSYFLTTNRIDFGYIYDNCLIAFDHPKDSRLFFLWVWEVLFPFEDYNIEDVKKYSEIEDINEANNYL